MRFLCHPPWLGEQADFPRYLCSPVLLNYHLASSELDDLGHFPVLALTEICRCRKVPHLFPIWKKTFEKSPFRSMFPKKSHIIFCESWTQELLPFGLWGITFKDFPLSRKKPLPSSRNWREKLALTNLKDFLKPLWPWPKKHCEVFSGMF